MLEKGVQQNERGLFKIEKYLAIFQVLMVLSDQAEAKKVEVGDTLETGIHSLVDDIGKESREQLAVGYLAKGKDGKFVAKFFHSNYGKEESFYLDDEDKFLDNLTMLTKKLNIQKLYIFHTHPKGKFILPSIPDFQMALMKLSEILPNFKRIVPVVNGMISDSGLWIFTRNKSFDYKKLENEKENERFYSFQKKIKERVEKGEKNENLISEIKSFYASYGVDIELIDINGIDKLK